MFNNVNKIHFIGIGGYGMSALAKVFLQNGYEITGSDITPSSLISSLENMGAKINLFHSKDNVDNTDLVVYSTAIYADNEEIKAAKEKNIPLWHRSELLAHLFNEKDGIGVAGAHGKTTTTSMISLILAESGLDPTALIGGELSNFGGNARTGGGDKIVAEACESDHSFLRYNSYIAVITNIEADHLEYYDGDFEKLLKTYEEFLANLKPGGVAVVSADCDHIKRVIQGVDKKLITFGKSDDADYVIDDIKLFKGGSKFVLKENGKANELGTIELGTIEMQVPGEHNIQNSAAAAVVALQLGIDFDKIKKALSKFKGAKRRFTIVGKVNDTVIVDDYAHHPTEIEATLKTAKNECEGNVIAVFQPHRYSRTKFLMEEFAESFGYADKIILNKVYPAGEEPIEGVSSDILADKIIKSESLSTKEVLVMDDKDDIVKYLEDTVKPGDYVITMGAGDIYKAAEDLKEKLELDSSNKAKSNG
ncbi:UDP-N-acetylmuramate--L-alanine ligase [Natranaerofaba carboxydovora]|uniref:UDP-N-acetylmuramate--L-alanine ligase n=1 Tax=Natranaerofaba carboxydovora TaxID=2742683 RepID=UPI001F136648|nr:UDP-N-acetylmuramate--L-alanine ligase [Natranaerofaba carboxydovora]UMZ74850.1 UDP-N-acetylmuramate--L-alanine ligase [Natranaerofaba carboxydovora]